MFYREDPSGKGYTTRAHLAELVGMLGPPPLDLLRRGIRSSEFFAEDGKPSTEYALIAFASLTVLPQVDGSQTLRSRRTAAWKRPKNGWKGRTRRAFSTS